ncbi:MAG: hypothetical protein H6747_05630 [Deltaproteobacteria bacterium]|nr:hypothetical protein [Deltaproteobacteria bacterium]
MKQQLSRLIADLALDAITLRRHDFERPRVDKAAVGLLVEEKERSFVVETDGEPGCFRVVGRLALGLMRSDADGQPLPWTGQLWMEVEASYRSPRELPEPAALQRFAETSGSVHLAAFQRQYVAETLARAGLAVVWMPLRGVPS